MPTHHSSGSICSMSTPTKTDLLKRIEVLEDLLEQANVLIDKLKAKNKLDYYGEGVEL